MMPQEVLEAFLLAVRWAALLPGLRCSPFFCFVEAEMTPDLERIAAALADAQDYDYAKLEDWSPTEWDKTDFRRQARAALQALREPSEEVLREIVYKPHATWESKESAFASAKLAWQA